jgi:hypothetical protein
MTVTVEDLRARVETDLDTTVLQRILDAAVASVDRSAGKIANDTQTVVATNSDWLALTRRHTAIVSITERRRHSSDAVTLSSNDYREVGGYRILRLRDGDNAAVCWGSEVAIVFTPEVDTDVRDRVALDLSQVDLEFRAYDSEKSGDWSGSQKDYRARRRELLAQVREGRSPFA